MRTGIAGVGGIGSNVAVNLVRSGVTDLTLIDFDLVEPSNLNRQFYFADQIGKPKVEMLAANLKRIDPGVNLVTRCTRLDNGNLETLFGDCDIIVEGFDRSEDKKMVLELLGPLKKLTVSACGIAGLELDAITTRKIGNCFVVGDFTRDIHDHPLFCCKVAAVAAKMAEIVLTYGGYND
ncbi:sulfur carrier protein ThiS adenylyltransferase ThiF [Desulforhopalus singaporensis]|uniref:Sulfur carrier protein ThiS adenylyltransferase n=1 Tax=Desulforhopalus singaporensis TaxID=91360 RepID=A0A1H0Q8V7_9BACT|nr:sulfur carrier protein ThiS adenylyltransferase ThiF [Desulforhopalus singaporensis]SDP13630.1 sulfur carrier protein ThiS adenylyltransferase [Desulforhopalus singaporensis]